MSFTISSTNNKDSQSNELTSLQTDTTNSTTVAAVPVTPDKKKRGFLVNPVLAYCSTCSSLEESKETIESVMKLFGVAKREDFKYVEANNETEAKKIVTQESDSKKRASCWPLPNNIVKKVAVDCKIAVNPGKKVMCVVPQNPKKVHNEINT
jgi:hypothetical protein